MEQTTIKKLLTVYKLIIPDFQRNFVWKQSKKQQLLESLFRGFPIGAITLYDDNKGYYIIDGLQRINTLNQYLSCPSKVIPFYRFFPKVEDDIRFFLKEHELKISFTDLKNGIKKWYEALSRLYEFEKVSVLYNIFKNGKEEISKEFCDLEIVEELLDILKEKIEIAYDEIALIIYKGKKDDLPELFKNINTGSVALSQYEILQSVWNDYLLDKNVLNDTFKAFHRELEIIQDDYDIEVVKETGKYDIFKNIIGLNHMICCKEDADIIFRFSTFKKFSEPICFEDGNKKYFKNDSIAFEIYSTLLCGSSNQIVKAVELLYRNDAIRDDYAISQFVKKLNEIIIEAIEIAIIELKKNKNFIMESKYHSLYVLAGIIFSKYDIDIDNLTIKESPINQMVFQEALNIEYHIQNRWFVDENRQISFFKIKIEELQDIKKKNTISNLSCQNESVLKKGAKLEIRINEEIIEAYTVKEFYDKIFLYLIEHNVNFEESIPYATGKKRYLINWTNHHINGNIFLSPLFIKNYCIETHKSKNGALRDIYKFLKEIDVNVEYIK